MRLYIHLCILLMPINAYAQIWTQVAMDEEGVVMSYDRSTVKRSGHLVEYWEQIKYPKGKSTRSQVEGDCETDADRATKIIEYDAKGSISDLYLNDNPRWTTSPHGSVGSIVLRTVCRLSM